jgi:hypothetical protein
MKTLFIIYHEDLEDQVCGILQRGMFITRYTRVDDVIGAHMVEVEKMTGYMTDRRNRLILVIADEKTIGDIVAELQVLRNKEGHGLRGFVVDALQVF